MEKKIRPVGYLKTTKGSKTHIPGLIHREVRTKAGDPIPYVMNARSVLLYDPSLSLKDILASIDVLIRDIKLREVPESQIERIEEKVVE